MTPVVLPLTVNEVPHGDVLAALRGADILMRVSDLEKVGATGERWQRLIAISRVSGSVPNIEKGEAVSLSSLQPFITYKFDESALALSIRIDPSLLQKTELSIQNSRPSDIVYARDTTSFFNYSLSSIGVKRVTFFGESGTSIRGALLYNTVFRAGDGRWSRGLSSLNIDQRDHLRRWTIGDAIATSDALGGSALLGGVTVGRNFELDPYFIRYPSLSFGGAALTPSRVDIYVNGVLVAQRQLPPGPFDLKDLPITAGAGNMQVVIRDVFGGERIQSMPFYYSTTVLARGMTEYNYSAGAIRSDISTNHYGDPAMLAFYRRGVTDQLTVGGRAEATKNLWSAGSSVGGRSRFGDLSLSLAGSRAGRQSGTAALLTYGYLSRFGSFGTSVRKLSRDYATLSLPISRDRALLDVTAFFAFPVRHGSLAAQGTSTRMRDSPRVNRLSLSSSLVVTPRSSLLVSAGIADQAGKRSGEIFAGISIYTGRGLSADIAVGHRAGVNDVTADVQRPLPVGAGFGYRLQARTSDTVTSGSGQLLYQNGFGHYELTFDPLHVSRSPGLSAAGGLVVEGGAIHFTRPVQQSFALVRVPGLTNVRVYSSNQLIGRTDENGSLLVPNILPYYGNVLRIDDRDIPLDYKLSGVERTIAPPFRGGAVVEFPVQRVKIITGTVVVASKGAVKPPSYGELTLTRAGKTYSSPLGLAGNFYFEDVPTGSFDANVEFDDGSCSFTMSVPEGGASVVKLGQLTCSQNKGKQP